MSEIKIDEDLWDEDTEGVITAWLFDDGDSVSAGDVVAEVMVEKIQHEVEAPAGGTLSIKVAAEEAVNKGDVIGELS
ncbi:lipoyl domain-containing protein [Emcibacter nanhaiensis]|uniref:Biotin attachment protein n=1 Tax=Emcibacter nanhaiensis TaxID=1505037 RepID=A0A501PJ99_9PROT|nr:lipoyl domain-containing protein [Emcibacter nanhaiensis]TPD60207.1 biotin attachment protein [Emcibacter nanhaiensis]